MIRDPGPLHNIGNSVTSRDVPITEGVEEGDAPNSGFISRAFNGHPVMRFVATTAVTMAVAGVVSKMTKEGGLKLIKYAEESQAAKKDTTLISRLIGSGKALRQHFDELQGVSRVIAGESDPYSKLVFESEGKLTSGYTGKLSEKFSHLTGQEIREAGSAQLGNEPAAVWSLKDDIQQSLIRAGRKLPYELPAFYVTQKGVIDPLFGNRNQKDRKVKWYNPLDVISDFTKESAKTAIGMILPFEMAGAGASRATGSLRTLQDSMADIRSLTPFQQKAYRSFVNVSDVLAEVGHDFSGITDKLLKKSAQGSIAFDAAAEEYKVQNQGFNSSLKTLSRGLEAAKEKFNRQEISRQQLKDIRFDILFKGKSNLIDGEYKSVFDLIPSFSGVRSAFTKGKQEWKTIGRAYGAVDNALEFNKLLAGKSGADFDAHKEALEASIDKIKRLHSSKMSELARGVRILGGGGPGRDRITSGELSMGMKKDAYKDLVESQLIKKGISKKDAARFVEHLRIDGLPESGNNLTSVVKMGKMQGTSADHYEEILRRYRKVQRGGLKLATGKEFSGDALSESLEEAKAHFTTREFQTRLQNKIDSNWNKFYREDLHNTAGNILSPKKLSYHDFTGHQTEAKLEFLQRKTAQTLGIKLVESDGRLKSADEIKKALGQHGFDPNRFADLRGFLVRNKQLSSGIFRNNLNLFGLEQVSIDEARERGMFKHIRQDEQDIIRDIAGKMAINDPISNSIGLSKLDGVYKTKKGDILDFTAIKSTFARASHFFASEFKIPLLGFNPTDLFGYNSFHEMARSSPLQYVSSRSVQPFIGENGVKPDYYLWNRTKGSKGAITSYGVDSQTGYITSKVLPGKFRAIPTSSSNLISRHTRFAAGVDGESSEEITGLKGKLLKKIFGGDEDAALRFKNRMAIDSEQPNSLFRQYSRFKNRRFDPENPGAMARLLVGDEVKGPKGKILSLDTSTGAPRLIDQNGEHFAEITEEQIFRGFHHLSKHSFNYGMPQQVMGYLEENHPDLFTINGKKLSDLSSEKDLIQHAESAISSAETSAAQLRAAGRQDEAKEISTSSSRIKSMINRGNLNGASMMSAKSPTITTRLDEFKNEIFRYISQTNQITGSSNPNEMFIRIQEAIDHLSKQGIISASQKAEAQAAGLSTLFNFSAFSTYNSSVTERQNLMNFFESMRTNAPQARQLFDPYTKGEIAQVSGTMRKKFSPILSGLKKAIGTAPYIPDSLSTDPLGSGQSTTLIPTFGTVFNRNPKAAIKNVLGVTTYSDPESFSAASIPISQGVERLNRYFGSVGMGLDVSKFSGPLDLFARGMVGKRVLPLYAAGVAAMTVDRTIGGTFNKRDNNGEKVYSPFFLTKAAKLGVDVSAVGAGLTPGGMGFEEKRKQLLEGEVPIREGRFWPLGSTPFKGGKTMYYRPSWYRKLEAGSMFTSDTYGSPLEKFMFYNDISPLRPLDPYRFERKHYEDRPYPVTGEYFSGPFGPLVPLANATIGKVLKPQKLMHKDELAAGLASYAPAGESGAYDAMAYAQPSYGGGGGGGGGGGYGGPPSGARFGGAGSSSGFGGGGAQSGINSKLASRAGSTFLARGMTRKSIGDINANYIDYSYGPPKVSKVMSPRIVGSGSPLKSASFQYQTGEFGYRAQEMAGIYGFGAGALRERLGFGDAKFTPQRSVLQSASKGYGTGRAFWDLNLGGLGDVPLSGSEGVGNIEFSEIVRRFIPKERTGVDYINPIQNKMGKEHPFLPGSEYYINFKTGDPFTKVQEGELRLPGKGYERLHNLHPDASGKYGILDQLNILGDVAPYSNQYKTANAQVSKMNLDASQREQLDYIHQKVADITTKNNFSEYKYKYTSPEKMIEKPAHLGMSRIGEAMVHSDNFFLSKTIGKRSALEDWERSNVYGSTFPQWEKPIQSFIKPMGYKATQRNPLIASATLAAAGGLFGRTPRAKLFGTALGATAGFAISSGTKLNEFVTGERFMPEKRKKEVALEEYSDILNYVKNTRLAKMSRDSGDIKSAMQYQSAAQRTMYGADIYSSDIDSMSLAVPKRKREHFKALINAPEQERGKILSTAGRLERRMYEAAWGMDVEKLPDLTDYFTRHELPNEDWEGWNPNTSMDSVKIKTGQHMGLDMSQMGYYPQQIKEANLSNPSFPGFYGSNDRGDVAGTLRKLMSGYGVTGTVTPIVTPFGSQNINISAGVR